MWRNKVWRSKHSRVLSFFGGPTINWEDQIVLVTGGASGIGYSLVSTLGVMGVTVVVLDLLKREAEWGQHVLVESLRMVNSHTDHAVR